METWGTFVGAFQTIMLNQWGGLRLGEQARTHHHSLIPSFVWGKITLYNHRPSLRLVMNGVDNVIDFLDVTYIIAIRRFEITCAVNCAPS
jgi:hypothetical protein